jgi:hypothetical protein
LTAGVAFALDRWSRLVTRHDATSSHARRTREAAATVRLAATERAAITAAEHLALKAGHAVLVSSASARPFRARTLHRGPRLVDIVYYGPTERRWMYAAMRRNHTIVATTHRLARSIERSSRRRVQVIAHLPIAHHPCGPGGDDLTLALDLMGRAPGGWIAVFGSMHGKKDLALVENVVRSLPHDCGILIAGEPMNDGASLVSAASTLADVHPYVGVVPRRLSAGEVGLMLSRDPTVWLAEHRGTESMSGVLTDAIGARRPVITHRDCATGDIVADCNLGQCYAETSPEAVLEAFRGASTAEPDRCRMEHHGFHEPKEWGAAMRSALGLSELSTPGAPP